MAAAGKNIATSQIIKEDARQDDGIDQDSDEYENPEIHGLDKEASESDDDPDPQDIERGSYNNCQHKLQLEELSHLIEQYNKAFSTRAAKPPFDDISSRAEHNREQRMAWKQLRDKAASDESIPNAIFDPPRTFVQVRVAQWPRPGDDHYCCPCDLDDEVLQAIDIRAPKDSRYGITKDLLLEQIGEAFYGREAEDNTGSKGESSSSVSSDIAVGSAAYLIGDEDSRPVVASLNFMIQNGGSLMGHIYAMTRGIIEEGLAEEE